MANNYQILSEDAIKYLCGLIRDLASVSEGIDNINLADNKTFSNIYIKNLIDKCLEDANAEAEKLVGALTHLTCEETAIQPTLDNSEINVIYLYSANGNPPYQQFLKISEYKLVDLGSTSISLEDYIKAADVAKDYATKVELKAVTDKIGTTTLTTTDTTITGAIEEVKGIADGKVDKTSIVTALGDSVTDDQVTSALLAKTELGKINANLGELLNKNRRQRQNITSNLSNLSKAIAEQNLEKYGYTIGDYFAGTSGYKYHLADLDTCYGGYNSYGVVGTHHIGIVVDTGANTEWLSSGTVTSYNKSTLHAFLTSTVLDKVKSDITALFGNWNSHLLTHQMLDNAIGIWGDSDIWVADTYIKAMSEVEIYGSTVFSADGFQTGIANKKLSIFNKFKYNEIFGNKNIWLKSLSSASDACIASGDGCAAILGVSKSRGAVGLILFY